MCTIVVTPSRWAMQRVIKNSGSSHISEPAQELHSRAVPIVGGNNTAQSVQLQGEIPEEGRKKNCIWAVKLGGCSKRQHLLWKIGSVKKCRAKNKSEIGKFVVKIFVVSCFLWEGIIVPFRRHFVLKFGARHTLKCRTIQICVASYTLVPPSPFYSRNTWGGRVPEFKRRDFIVFTDKNII